MLRTSTEIRTDDLHRHVLNGETMGTRYSAVFYSFDAHVAPELPGRLFEAVDAVDRQMSPWKPASDLMRLNAAEPGRWIKIPAEFCKVLEAAVRIGAESGGAFDPAVGDLVNAWGFGASGTEQQAAGIAGQFRRCRSAAEAKVEIDAARCRARRLQPVSLDLCGIAKGYGVDRMIDCLRDFGIEHALVGIDGEMRAIGSKPEGRPWAIAVECPNYDERAAMGVIALENAAVATSGDYRHWVEVDGMRLSHTMDPREGWPLDNRLASVTVVADSCMAADAWATALMVLGEDLGPDVARRKRMNALFVVRDGTDLVQHPVGEVFGGL